MKKKDLTGGVANLLSGADQRVTKTPKGNSETTGATPEEAKLLATIEDEEFRKELEERLRKKRLIGRGRPRKNDQLGNRTDGYERTSLIIHKEKWAKIREIAFQESLTMKEIVELALDMVIARYEDKHGEIKPLERPKRNINEIF